MVESRGSRRFAVFFIFAAFIILLLGRWLKPVDHVVVSVTAPFAAAFSRVADGVGGGISGVFDGPRLRSSNIELKKENALLVQRNAQYQEQVHELKLLRAMLHFHDKNPSLKLLAARVIITDPNDPRSLAPNVIINLGKRDGLRAGMTVLDQNGYFVGSISDLAANYSRVILLINPSSTVGVMDLQTRAIGLADGQFATRPVFDNVLASSVLRPGDFVVTSGQANLFPRGILIGQVGQVHQQNVNVLQSADLVPAADFSDLEMVQVVKNYVPSAPTVFIGNR